MNAHAMSTMNRTVPQQRRGAAPHVPINLATLIAEAVFFALNADSIADVGAAAALAASVP